MTKKQIQIPRTLANQLLHQAQLSPSREVSGLVGMKGEHSECYPIDGTALDASVLFALSASEHHAAIEAMQAKGQSLYASYHSHPDSPALPNMNELDEALRDDVLYLMISLNTKGVLEMRGFIAEQQRLQEVDLVL
jgi:proteasome lid subunit RPN8/RPN11